MEERRIEGLWDCVYCGTKAIKARYDTCLSCGRSRGVETVFYLPDDLAAATLTEEEKELSKIAHDIYKRYPSDGKYVLGNGKLIICQSNVPSDDLKRIYPNAIVNPLGDWTGGTDVDAGATNRKLGSDMAQSVSGGGVQGKDLSKADVSVNIYAFLKAQQTGKKVELFCAIGDETIDGKPYREIVEIARNYIKEIGGFERFAEWGLF